MIIVPFKAEHALRIDLQDAQRIVESEVSARELEAGCDAITGLVGDQVIFCLGRARQWEGRYVLWAMLSKDACKHMLAITRAARRALELCEGRLEAVVRSDFAQGHRWAQLVGLKFHHHEEMFLPDGSDADVYVRFS